MSRRAPGALLLVVAAALLTGCGGSPDDSDDPSAGTSPHATASTTPSTTAGATPSASATPSPSASATPSATPSASPLRTPGPLLSAAELPSYAAAAWRQGATTTREPRRPFATCQRFGILSIGAQRVVLRRFTGAVEADLGAGSPRATAGELVASFPDDVTARRAYAVLVAWRQQCADRLATFTRAEVGALTGVTVPGGTAGWYLLTYGPTPGGGTYQDAQGMAVVGTRIALVTMRRTGPGATRPPMALALQRAAQKLP